MASLQEMLGENVRAARAERGWTQEDLADRTDLSTVQISRIERGRREIRLGILIRVIDGLEVQPDRLLAGLYRISQAERARQKPQLARRERHEPDRGLSLRQKAPHGGAQAARVAPEQRIRQRENPQLAAGRRPVRTRAGPPVLGFHRAAVLAALAGFLGPW